VILRFLYRKGYFGCLVTVGTHTRSVFLPYLIPISKDLFSQKDSKRTLGMSSLLSSANGLPMHDRPPHNCTHSTSPPPPLLPSSTQVQIPFDFFLSFSHQWMYFLLQQWSVSFCAFFWECFRLQAEAKAERPRRTFNYQYLTLRVYQMPAIKKGDAG
jgi:hypothetical protein